MKVIKCKENKDGSLKVTIDITESEKRAIRKVYGAKRLTKKLFRTFIIDAAIDACLDLKQKEKLK